MSPLHCDANLSISKQYYTANRLIYVTNFGNDTVSTCPINHCGNFGPCTASNPGSTFFGPGTIVLSSDGSFAYVSNFNNNTVSVCPTNTSGALTACTASAALFDRPSGVAINTRRTFAYVVNFSGNSISICPLNADGHLRTSGTLFSDPTFLYPDSILLNNLRNFSLCDQL